MWYSLYYEEWIVGKRDGERKGKGGRERERRRKHVDRITLFKKNSEEKEKWNFPDIIPDAGVISLTLQSKQRNKVFLAPFYRWGN